MVGQTSLIRKELRSGLFRAYRFFRSAFQVHPELTGDVAPSKTFLRMASTSEPGKKLELVGKKKILAIDGSFLHEEERVGAALKECPVLKGKFLGNVTMLVRVDGSSRMGILNVEVYVPEGTTFLKDASLVISDGAFDKEYSIVLQRNRSQHMGGYARIDLSQLSGSIQEVALWASGLPEYAPATGN